MSYLDAQPPPPINCTCTNIAPPPPLAPNPYYPWPPPIPYPPPLHDPYYQWPFLSPPPPSNSQEAWYKRATPLVLFLILFVALISALTSLVCKCFNKKWSLKPSNSITAATNATGLSSEPGLQ